MLVEPSTADTVFAGAQLNRRKFAALRREVGCEDDNVGTQVEGGGLELPADSAMVGYFRFHQSSVLEAFDLVHAEIDKDVEKQWCAPPPEGKARALFCPQLYAPMGVVFVEKYKMIGERLEAFLKARLTTNLTASDVNRLMDRTQKAVSLPVTRFTAEAAGTAGRGSAATGRDLTWLDT